MTKLDAFSAWLAVFMLAALTITGCAGTTDSRLDEPSATPKPHATGDSLPPEYSGPATCSNLLDESTRSRLAEEGIVDFSDGYRESISRQPDLFLYRFLQTGGIVCVYGPANSSDGTVFFAYSPIDADRAEQERSDAIDAEAQLRHEDGYDVFEYPSIDGAAFPASSLAVGDGFWAVCIDMGDGASIDEIAANARSY